jgi:hypothetical protein
VLGVAIDFNLELICQSFFELVLVGASGEEGEE